MDNRTTFAKAKNPCLGIVLKKITENLSGATTKSNANGRAPSAVGSVLGELSANYYLNNNYDPSLNQDQNTANAVAFAKVISATSGVVTQWSIHSGTNCRCHA